ncbi:hypothetical protein [Lacimonas salitolerans]|uniref:hypothetical protein n=1 Tax=Lacimonas salitolerans TaxID=1323750 RepID=UPI0036D28EBB
MIVSLPEPILSVCPACCDCPGGFGRTEASVTWPALCCKTVSGFALWANLNTMICGAASCRMVMLAENAVVSAGFAIPMDTILGALLVILKSVPVTAATDDLKPPTALRMRALTETRVSTLSAARWVFAPVGLFMVGSAGRDGASGVRRRSYEALPVFGKNWGLISTIRNSFPEICRLSPDPAAKGGSGVS